MSRIMVVHWRRAEALERAAPLRDLGHEIELGEVSGPDALRRIGKNPPDACLIDMTRSPSHGEAVALAMRQSKATRHIPLLFLNTGPAKLDRLRSLLPDAFYTDWDSVPGDLAAAIAAAPESPVVPRIMAGYSGTPLVKKLGIKPGCRALLLGAPKGFEKTFGALPEGARISRRPSGKPNLVLLFVKSRQGLQGRLPAAIEYVAERGGLWIAWPKKASGISTDLSENMIRSAGLASGWVDYKICAIDNTWSGLLFARRRAG